MRVFYILNSQYIIKYLSICIIGMDAAQPLFTFPFHIDAAKRLDSGDAKFVQAIHTSCNTLGVAGNVGHADYYLNGGAIQPLCIGGGLLRITDDSPGIKNYFSLFIAANYMV